MHRIIILFAILTILIIIILIGFTSDGFNTSINQNKLDVNQIENVSYVKFCHLIPCLPGFVDVFIGGKIVLKNAYFGKISSQFVKINSGENKISIISGTREIFNENIYFSNNSHNICIANNLENILKITAKGYSQLLSVIDSLGPLFIILKNIESGEENKYKLNYGVLSPINLGNGNYEITVKDIRGLIVLKQKIKISGCKIYTIGGNINENGRKCDEIGVHTIIQDREVTETKHILDISENFEEDRIDGEWDNESGDLFDINF